MDVVSARHLRDRLGIYRLPSHFSKLDHRNCRRLFNLFLLQKKIDIMGEKAANNQTAKSFGTLSRFAAAALVVVIILRYPEQFHIIAAVVGLMTPYLVIMIDFIFSSKKTTSTKRGE